MQKIEYIRVFRGAEGAVKFFWPLGTRYFDIFS